MEYWLLLVCVYVVCWTWNNEDTILWNGFGDDDESDGYELSMFLNAAMNMRRSRREWLVGSHLCRLAGRAAGGGELGGFNTF